MQALIIILILISIALQVAQLLKDYKKFVAEHSLEDGDDEEDA